MTKKSPPRVWGVGVIQYLCEGRIQGAEKERERESESERERERGSVQLWACNPPSSEKHCNYGFPARLLGSD